MTAPPMPARLGFCFKRPNAGGQERPAQPHVAVHQNNKFAAAVLEAQLRAGTAGSVCGIIKLDDLDRIFFRDRYGAVRGGAVGENNLAADPGERRERALDGSGNVPFLVERLDDDTDSRPLVFRHDCSSRLHQCHGTAEARVDRAAQAIELALQCRRVFISGQADPRQCVQMIEVLGKNRAGPGRDGGAEAERA